MDSGLTINTFIHTSCLVYIPVYDVTSSYRTRSGFYHKLLNTKSLELDPTIIDLLSPRPLKLSLGDGPSMDEMTEALKGRSNLNAVGPDGLPAELPKINHPTFAQCFQNLLANVWVTGGAPQQ